MSNVHHIGDLHLDHKNIWKYREGVSSTEENNTIMVDNILTSCGKRDTLWLHGDIFFSRESLEYLIKMKQHIQNIHFLFGNHDFERMSRELQKECYLILVENTTSIGGLVKNKSIWHSHGPMHAEELRGSINIHGHVHQHTLDDERLVNVSADNTAFKPINRKDILDGWRTCQ